MIPSFFSHRQYLRYVRHQARHYGGLPTTHRHFHVWRKLQATNLDAAYPILARLYCVDWGRMARDPLCMLRSCPVGTNLSGDDVMRHHLTTGRFPRRGHRLLSR